MYLSCTKKNFVPNQCKFFFVQWFKRDGLPVTSSAPQGRKGQISWPLLLGSSALGLPCLLIQYWWLYIPNAVFKERNFKARHNLLECSNVTVWWDLLKCFEMNWPWESIVGYKALCRLGLWSELQFHPAQPLCCYETPSKLSDLPNLSCLACTTARVIRPPACVCGEGGWGDEMLHVKDIKLNHWHSVLSSVAHIIRICIPDEILL